MPAQYKDHPADSPKNRELQRWRGYTDALMGSAYGQSDNMGPITQGLMDAYRTGYNRGYEQYDGWRSANEDHPMWGQQVTISGKKLDPRVNADGMTGQITFVYQMKDGEVRAEIALDVDKDDFDEDIFAPTTADVPLSACSIHDHAGSLR